MDSPHPHRMSWTIIKSNTNTWPMKIGVKSYSQTSLKTTGKGHQHRSRRSTLIERPPYLTATNTSGYRGSWRKYLGLVSYAPTKDPTTRGLHITVSSATACFARSQECLRKSLCRTVRRNVLESVPTRRPSNMDCDDLWEVGIKLWNITISPRVNGRKIWRLSISKTIYIFEFPRSPSCAAKPRISRRSGKNLPKSTATLAATLPGTSMTPIPHYPEISTEIHIDGLLDVRRWINWIT